MTAYLTGLRTNSVLFDPGVLARCSVMSMLPDFGLTILSFTIYRDLRLAAIGIFFFSSRRRHTRCSRDWSSDVCSSDLAPGGARPGARRRDRLDHRRQARRSRG